MQNFKKKKILTQDLDNVVKGLLAEAGKSNEFIRNAAEEALTAMSENVTPQRAMIALVQEGARYKRFLQLFWANLPFKFIYFICSVTFINIKYFLFVVIRM